VIALAISLLVAGAGNESRLPVIKPAADFALVDANDRRVTLKQFRGKAVLVGFIFTTCNGTCPATTHRMAKVQQELARHPELNGKVQLLSITLDPERDTPDALRRYAGLYEIDPSNWSLVTGPKAEVARTLAAWDMWARPAANGQLDHPSRVYLVDPHGRIREIYNLDFLRVPWVVEDIREVLNGE
jgi:protein SCO1/2